jgi:hypothetical protein
MKDHMPQLILMIGVLFGVFYGFANVTESFQQKMYAQTVMINYDAPITETQIERTLGVKKRPDDD